MRLGSKGGMWTPISNSVLRGKFVAGIFLTKMVSVEETIDALYLAHGEGLLSDEEFLLLFEEIMPNSDFKQSNFPYTEYEPLNWETYMMLLLAKLS